MTRSSPLVLLVCLALLVSGQALASPRPSLGSPAPARQVRLLTADEPQPRFLTDAPAPTEEGVGEGGAARFGRLLAELGLGAVSGAAGGLLGAVVLGAACGAGTAGCVLGFFAGPLLGFSLGTAVGVYGAGELLGGHGGLGGPFLGALLGTAVGLTVSLTLSSGLDLSTLFLGPAVGLVGALIGYEVSQQPPDRQRLRPLLSVSPRGGGLLGLAGSF
jgi:hypothetical protein